MQRFTSLCPSRHERSELGGQNVHTLYHFMAQTNLLPEWTTQKLSQNSRPKGINK